MMVFCTNKEAGILLSVGTPLVASMYKPFGHPMINALKIEIVEFLLICAPHTKRLLPLFERVAFGPNTVMFENTAAVCGNNALPFASLSLSKDSLFEISATEESLSAIPNSQFLSHPSHSSISSS